MHEIREFRAADWPAVWPMLKATFAAGGTYTFPPDIPDAAAQGRGIAAAMCEHSQRIAVELGFRAMQFNFVVASNERAVRLWERLGFTVVGRLPGAFRHQKLGFVDALVMFKTLVPADVVYHPAP
jgi:RimJ/RimL family protein N-acetyltransferase